MLKEIEIPIDNLLLDPNNPRFIADLKQHHQIPDAEMEKRQEETLKCFSKRPRAADSEFDVTNIKDLYDSMLRIGFVGIDRIVVRQIVGSKKYLVLEGNRRIAAVKSILSDYRDKVLNKPDDREAVEAHKSSFEKITAMVLDTKGLAPDEIAHKVAVLLGIRHHGSLLEWEPLPKACNIYTEYMEEPPKKETFNFDNKKARDVARRLCIETGDVTDALRTYVAFLQARERFTGVQDDHFSLIAAGVKDKHLAVGYFRINPDTFELDEASLAKLNMVCQFETRDSGKPELTTNNRKKILRDPKRFKLLGRLLDRKQRAAHPAIKNYAEDLINRATNEDDLELTLDGAVDDLTAFENRTKWAEALGKLLDKQEADLSLEKYSGDGADRGHKDELKMTLDPLRRIMNI